MFMDVAVFKVYGFWCMVVRPRLVSCMFMDAVVLKVYGFWCMVHYVNREKMGNSLGRKEVWSKVHCWGLCNFCLCDDTLFSCLLLGAVIFFIAKERWEELRGWKRPFLNHIWVFQWSSVPFICHPLFCCLILVSLTTGHSSFLSVATLLYRSSDMKKSLYIFEVNELKLTLQLTR